MHCFTLRRRVWWGAVGPGLLGLLLACLAGPAAAQPQSGYSNEWFTADGGGLTLSFGVTPQVPPQLRRLAGTVGQPDAGVLTGGSYRLVGGYWTGAIHVLTSVPTPEPIPDGAPFRVLNPRPNPTRAGVTLAIQLPVERDVTLTVFDVSGRRVRTVSLGRLGPGRHAAVWDGTDQSGARVASGVYFTHVRAGEFAARDRLVLLGQ